MSENAALSDPTGTPCWYELTTTDPAAATAFYGAVLGWNVQDSGMEGMTYLLASAPDGGMVAGMADSAEQEGDAPPGWLVYFATADCDASFATATAAGAGVIVEPSDIPGTGRFAICTDPQGAVFALLQPAPMAEPPASGAFNQEALGHGNWHELMTPDPQAAFTFYADLLGWTKGQAMDMGEDGTYQLFASGGTDIGGMMGLLGSPQAAWLPYFGVDSVTGATSRIADGGGTVVAGPHAVPGGAFIAVAQDGQGAHFAVTGPESA